MKLLLICLRNKVIVLALCLFFLLGGISNPINAEIYKVPSQQATIQAAINVAKTGDVVWVAQGTYTENITLKNGIKLEGGWKKDYSARNWTAWPSVIDGAKLGSVVIGANGATLDGFTIQNGSAKFGGGIFLKKAAMTIKNNTIQDNFATSGGGGIYLWGIPKAPPYTDIQNNIIRKNKVTTNQGGFGGGILLSNSQNGVRITNNTIGGQLGDGNTARSAGGGIDIEFTPIFIVEENTISQNTVDQGHGGGVMINGGSPNSSLCRNIIKYNGIKTGNFGGGVYSIGGTFICRNTISYNSIFSSIAWGGGLAVDSPQGTPPRIENNFIHNNMAVQGQGGGIYIVRGDHIILMNNSIANNTPDTPQSGGGIYIKSGATCILQNNILWANGDDFHEEDQSACILDHNDIEDGDALGQKGNISADPLFVSYDDLHITKGSPAINSGNKAAAPNIDYDGDSRSSKIDIGADELKGEDNGSTCPFIQSAQASYLEPYVDDVRNFRDNHLITNGLGQRVTKLYYQMAPFVSGLMSEHPTMQTLVRWLLTPVVMIIIWPEILLVLLVLIISAGLWVKIKKLWLPIKVRRA